MEKLLDGAPVQFKQLENACASFLCNAADEDVNLNDSFSEALAELPQWSAMFGAAVGRIEWCDRPLDTDDKP